MSSVGRSRSLSLESFSTISSDSSFSSAVDVAPNTRHRLYFFNDTRSVIFQLDDGTQYKVHRYPLSKRSREFAAQYLSDADENAVKRLEGVSRRDFDRFMSLIYPTELGRCDIQTPEEWISILRLAKLWSFEALRVRALAELDNVHCSLVGSATDRIVLSREVDVPHWRLQAFEELCLMEEGPSFADVERLGLYAFFEVARIRENRLKATTSGSAAFDLREAVLNAGLAPPTSDPEHTRPPSCELPRAQHPAKQPPSTSKQAGENETTSRCTHAPNSMAPCPADKTYIDSSTARDGKYVCRPLRNLDEWRRARDQDFVAEHQTMTWRRCVGHP